MKINFGKYSIIRIARVLGVAGIIVLLFFSIKLKSNTNIKKLNIELVSNLQNKLIAKKDIIKYLNKALDKDLEIETIEKLELSKIENLLNQSKFIRKADVYIDSKNNLQINCTLRDPIVRISRNKGKDFYLDKFGNPIPISKRATIRVPIINGYINVKELAEVKKNGTVFYNILDLVKKINSDKFLNALVEQIYVDKNNKLTIIPKLGRQKIEFGNLVDIDDKLIKIKTIYKSGMLGSGWNKFEKLNLEIEGQVVATKIN